MHKQAQQCCSETQDVRKLNTRSRTRAHNNNETRAIIGLKHSDLAKDARVMATYSKKNEKKRRDGRISRRWTDVSPSKIQFSRLFGGRLLNERTITDVFQKSWMVDCFCFDFCYFIWWSECLSCRSPRKIFNEPLLAKIVFDRGT